MGHDFKSSARQDLKAAATAKCFASSATFQIS